MKKTTLLILLLTITISNLSAQEKNWSDIYDFEVTVLNDSTMIKSNYGSRSVYAEDGDAVYHSMYINSDSIEDIISGKVINYSFNEKQISLIGNDSTITQFDVEFLWIYTASNDVVDTAFVRQLYFNSNETGYSIKVERVDFHNGTSYMSCGGKEPFIDEKETKLTLPVIFRIKRIAVNENMKDDLKYPEEIINYAEWTNKGFYRYSVTGEKDSLIFGGTAERMKVMDRFETITFDNTNGDSFIFSNFYLNEEPHYYVSTMDVYKFPYDGGELNSYNETLKSQIWEKMNLNLEFTKMLMKLKLVGEEMMFDSEHELLIKKVLLLMKFSEDSDLRNKI